MGWQESRVLLLPPDRCLIVEEAPKARTVNGKPLLILHSRREEGTPTRPVSVRSLQEWLEERGFAVQEQSTSGVRLAREDVDAWLFADGGELSQVDLAFTLSRDCPARWETWQAFVTQLCQAWDLRLADAASRSKVGPEELLRLLAETVSWQDFQKAFQWPAVAPASKD